MALGESSQPQAGAPGVPALPRAADLGDTPQRWKAASRPPGSPSCLAVTRSLQGPVGGLFTSMRTRAPAPPGVHPGQDLHPTSAAHPWALPGLPQPTTLALSGWLPHPSTQARAESPPRLRQPCQHRQLGHQQLEALSAPGPGDQGQLLPWAHRPACVRPCP